MEAEKKYIGRTLIHRWSYCAWHEFPAGPKVTRYEVIGAYRCTNHRGEPDITLELEQVGNRQNTRLERLSVIGGQANHYTVGPQESWDWSASPRVPPFTLVVGVLLLALAAILLTNG